MEVGGFGRPGRDFYEVAPRLLILQRSQCSRAHEELARLLIEREHRALRGH
jgi:hypothetical protein